ncbi:hypothetical protein FBEOM_12769 [Fusarium beomiforme]|uniref:Uncharacterized protein n=1 Tax=Fusarium beomiforme TaxID=44412 RepID=A0A9P5A879_9HYPO|nr:hypothetical protein FBEOM_12769 [Fusarium beomiforme]
MSSAVCIPIQVSTFTLNSAVATSGKDVPNWCIGPLSQPGYDRLLRYENDVQQHVDLLNRHRLDSLNPRLFDASDKKIRQGRQGFYLHWKLPQLYRAAVEVNPGAEPFKNECFKNGFRSFKQSSNGDVKWNADANNALIGESTTLYRAVPNRWLVWRRIDQDSIEPEEAKHHIKTYELFIMESNLCRNISDLGAKVDIEVDVSPFVNAEKPPEGQADNFLGNKIAVYEDGAQPPDKNEGDQKSVPLSIFNSSNPIFADFQPHNSNVFSMIDNFSYQYPLGDGKSETRFLMAANADYTVLGWVDDMSLDVFADKNRTHGEILKGLGLELADEKAGDAQAWLRMQDKKSDITRAICHASIYGVKWRQDMAPENKAHELANLFKSQMPIAVGYSPVDSYRAFTKQSPIAFQGLNGAKLHSSLTNTPKSFGDLLYEVQTFTKTSAGKPDNYIAQRDRALLQAFAASSAGHLWKLIDNDEQANRKDTGSTVKTSLIPSDTQKLALSGLRQFQSFRDACSSKLKQLQWDLFAEWWKFKTSEQKMSHGDLSDLRSSSSDTVRAIASDIRRLLSICQELDNELSPEKVTEKCPQAQKTPNDPFYRRREPTVTIAGAVSAWSIRDDKQIQVRLTSQVKPDEGEEQETKGSFAPKANGIESPEDSLYKAVDFHRPPMNGIVSSTMQDLVREWVRLRPRNDQDPSKLRMKPSIVNPPYKVRTAEDGQQLGNVPSFNQKQEFNAVFVEWEVVYFHIPFDKWSLQPDEATGLRWDLNDYVGSGYADDARAISGRELLLPQVKAELQAAAGNISASPEELQKLLLDRLAVPSTSFALKGMNEHLATRYVGGTHLTPNATISGVVKGAVVESVFTEDDIKLIGNQTLETPYAATVDVGATDGDPSRMNSPFKPVLHGQMVLTKLNIMDEFGQVVSAFDFNKAQSDGRLSRQIYPYISDTYSCSNLVDPHGKPTKIANAVVGDQENRCAFIQIPPSINQEAKLNAFFVTDKDVFGKLLPSDEPYRPVYEQWENPVWGWILVNYASHGIQFFLPDGKFYGQVLLGGSTGTDIPLRWQPFEEPRDLDTFATNSVDVRRLQELMDAFRGDTGYLKAFVHMIGESLTFSRDMNASYSESLASITGRCLALVDFGVSLELAQKPQVNQSTINDAPPQLALESYKFPCILGDKSHRDDGLVGYFASSSESSRKPDFTTCYTYFPQAKTSVSKNKITDITIQNSPLLQPKYVDPLEVTRSLYVEPEDALNSDTLDRMSSEYRKQTTNRLKIFTAIINPYTPFRIRTGGLLPTKALEIPPWTIKNALEKMDVFFPTGPVLSVKAPFSKPQTQSINKPAVQQEVIKRTEGDKATEMKIEVPTPPVGKWKWLQPVIDDDRSKTNYKDIATDGFKRIDEGDILRVNEKQPLTAIEGYLCMSRGDDRKKA